MKLRFNLMISICLLALLTGCREMPRSNGPKTRRPMRKYSAAPR